MPNSSFSKNTRDTILSYCWVDKEFHTFPKGIFSKVNVIARLEYELIYYDSTVHRFNHYTTMTPPSRRLSLKDFFLKTDKFVINSPWGFWECSMLRRNFAVLDGKSIQLRYSSIVETSIWIFCDIQIKRYILLRRIITRTLLCVHLFYYFLNEVVFIFLLLCRLHRRVSLLSQVGIYTYIIFTLMFVNVKEPIDYILNYFSKFSDFPVT